jgi:hypothetical protein
MTPSTSHSNMEDPNRDRKESKVSGAENIVPTIQVDNIYHATEKEHLRQIKLRPSEALSKPLYL